LNVFQEFSRGRRPNNETFEETPIWIAIFMYLTYAIMVVIGHIRDSLRSIGLEEEKSCTESKRVVSNMVMNFCEFILSLRPEYLFMFSE